MRGSGRLILGWLVAVLLPLSALGQQQQKLRDRDPDLAATKKLTADLQRANFHSGPWYYLSQFRLSDAGYSEASYVPTSEDATGNGFSLSMDAPQRLYFVPRKKTIFSVEFVPGYTYFSGQGAENQFNYSARADAHFLLNHLYLDVYGSRADQLRAHIADINRLATTKEDEVGVAGELKYSSRTSSLFAVRYRDTSYPTDRVQPELGEIDDDFNPIQLLDRDERHARLSLNHKTFPLTSLFVSGEFSDYKFENAGYKDSNRRFAGGGAQYDSGRTQARVEAGSLTLDFEDPLQQDFSGVSGGASVSRAFGRATARVAVERDLGFSIFANNNYFVSNAATAGVQYVATRRLTLRVNSSYQEDTYDVPVDGEERRDTISFSSVGFLYTIRRLAIGADVGWYERNTTFAGDTDAGIRTIVHLSFTP